MIERYEKNISKRINELKDINNTIKFITFNREFIDIVNKSDRIIFKNCTFNNAIFNYIHNLDFIDCDFIKCDFYDINDCSIIDCDFEDCKTDNNGLISGNCEFTNCKGITFTQIVKSNEESKENIHFDYGYKIVQVPILVKLSFPKDTKFIGVEKFKVRADKAKVEYMTIIDSGQNVVNSVDNRDIIYKTNKMVYPDIFNDNPLRVCTHGIHFCSSPDDLDKCNILSKTEMQIIKNIIKNKG